MSFSYEIAWVILACGYICEAFSEMTAYVRGPNPLWMVLSLVRKTWAIKVSKVKARMQSSKWWSSQFFFFFFFASVPTLISLSDDI